MCAVRLEAINFPEWEYEWWRWCAGAGRTLHDMSILVEPKSRLVQSAATGGHMAPHSGTQTRAAFEAALAECDGVLPPAVG